MEEEGSANFRDPCTHMRLPATATLGTHLASQALLYEGLVPLQDVLRRLVGPLFRVSDGGHSAAAILLLLVCC